MVTKTRLSPYRFHVMVRIDREKGRPYWDLFDSCMTAQAAGGMALVAFEHGHEHVRVHYRGDVLLEWKHGKAVNKWKGRL